MFNLTCKITTSGTLAGARGVENFEKLMRGTYKVNGKAIGGTVIEHKIKK